MVLPAFQTDDLPAEEREHIGQQLGIDHHTAAFLHGGRRDTANGGNKVGGGEGHLKGVGVGRDQNAGEGGNLGSRVGRLGGSLDGGEHILSVAGKFQDNISFPGQAVMLKRLSWPSLTGSGFLLLRRVCAAAKTMTGVS